MSKSFNADSYLQSITKPTITLDGVEYEAKLLSFRDAVRFQHQLTTVDMANPDELLKFVTDVCAATNLPAEKIIDLPPQVFNKVVEGFFGYLLTGASAE